MKPYRFDLESKLKQSPIDDYSIEQRIHRMIDRQKSQTNHSRNTKQLSIGLIAALMFALVTAGILVSPVSQTIFQNLVATSSTVGDYIVDKENTDNGHRILVASNISESEAEKSVSELMEKRTDLVWYTLEDINLYEDIALGEKVTVKPKTFLVDGKEMSFMDQSYPGQTVAGEIIRHTKQTKQENGIHKTIAPDQIVHVTMSKWVYGGMTVQQVGVLLSQEDIENVCTWFNSVPSNRVREVESVNPNLAAGIVFELKSNVEVRIQYDKKDVYVTRTDPEQDSQVRYIVDDPELTSFFDLKIADTVFPKNENGQTYGSAADATSPDNQPDLIQAFGVDGTLGYVLKKDLDGEKPRNPEEAIDMMKNRPPGGRDIPLYDVDGKTVIGVFHME